MLRICSVFSCFSVCFLWPLHSSFFLINRPSLPTHHRAYGAFTSTIRLPLLLFPVFLLLLSCHHIVLPPCPPSIVLCCLVLSFSFQLLNSPPCSIYPILIVCACIRGISSSVAALSVSFVKDWGSFLTGLALALYRMQRDLELRSPEPYIKSLTTISGGTLNQTILTLLTGGLSPWHPITHRWKLVVLSYSSAASQKKSCSTEETQESSTGTGLRQTPGRCSIPIS